MAHDPKIFLPMGPKKRPMTLEKSGGHFSEKKKRLRQCRGSSRASKKMGAIFLGKKKRLRQRRGSSRASRNMGGHFLTYGGHFLAYGGHFLALAAIHPWWGYRSFLLPAIKLPPRPPVAHMISDPLLLFSISPLQQPFWTLQVVLSPSKTVIA